MNHQFSDNIVVKVFGSSLTTWHYADPAACLPLNKKLHILGKRYDDRGGRLNFHSAMYEDNNYRKWILGFGALFLACVYTSIYFFPIHFGREQFLDVLRREATSDTFKCESHGAELIDLASLNGRKDFIRLVESAEDCNQTRITCSAACQRVYAETREISIEIEVCPNAAGEGIYFIIQSHRGIKGHWLRLLSRDPDLVKRYDPSTMKALP